MYVFPYLFSRKTKFFSPVLFATDCMNNDNLMETFKLIVFGHQERLLTRSYN